jgi:hypothetical protein
VPTDYTKSDVLTAFRREAKKAHSDTAGTAEMFRALVQARDRLLTALGTSALPPKAPTEGREARISLRSFVIIAPQIGDALARLSVITRRAAAGKHR